jgi:hypothetical protein
MPTSVSLDAITTADAAPTAAPHRISDKPGKDAVVVEFTVAGSGAVRAWATKLGGGGLTSGERVGGEGVICGLTRCGEAAPLARPLGPIVESLTYADVAPNADGEYTVNVYAATDDGWAL